MRSLTKEKRAFQYLKSIGLPLELDGRTSISRSDAVQWLTEHKQDLDQAGYLVQFRGDGQAPRYFLGKPEIKIRIGEKLDGKKAIQFFGDKIILLDGGAKWFIPSFIEFQYPSGLNENNKAHIGIIKNLERYKDEIANFKPLESPLQGAMDMVMDMVMVKDKVKDMVILPFESENFIKYWTFWKDFKNKQFNFKFKTAQSEQSALNDLVNLSDGFEETAIKIIEQSMAKGWKGLFKLKNDSNESGTYTNNTKLSYPEREWERLKNLG